MKSAFILTILVLSFSLFAKSKCPPIERSFYCMNYSDEYSYAITLSHEYYEPIPALVEKKGTIPGSDSGSDPDDFYLLSRIVNLDTGIEYMLHHPNFHILWKDHDPIPFPPHPVNSFSNSDIPYPPMIEMVLADFENYQFFSCFTSIIE